MRRAPDVLLGTATSYTHTYASAGRFTVTLTATDNSGSSSSVPFLETVTSVTTTPVNLTFQGFNLDDFDNGVGQLRVLVKGHLVVDLPAGLNLLSGSGDYAPYADKWVDFGPFDITSFVVNGQNNVRSFDPDWSPQRAGPKRNNRPGIQRSTPRSQKCTGLSRPLRQVQVLNPPFQPAQASPRRLLPLKMTRGHRTTPCRVIGYMTRINDSHPRFNRGAR